MWLNSATQENIQTLRRRGFEIIEPENGKLTSGDVGVGRYPDSSKIIEALNAKLEHSADLAGRKVLISAGGTQEAIDPVRFIGNHSSGRQGYALAYAAALRGADVTLVAANSHLADIEGIKTIHVTSALQMQEALEREFDSTDILIMSAAIADVRPAKSSERKISKENLFEIPLVENPDITKELSRRRRSQVMIGFAAQTEDSLVNGLELAAKKLQEKGLDFIYFNDVSAGAIFGSEETQGTIIAASGSHIDFPLGAKMTLAKKLLDLALDKLG